MGVLIGLIIVGVVVYHFWKKASERAEETEKQAREKEKEERVRDSIDTLAGIIVTEIEAYCAKNGTNLDQICNVSVSQFATSVMWSGTKVLSLRIEYKKLGYEIEDDKEPYGEKTLMLQKAIVSRLGSNWVVVSDKELVSYTQKSEVVVKGKDDGSVEVSHPKKSFYMIKSEIISRADYEERLKKSSRVITKI